MSNRYRTEDGYTLYLVVDGIMWGDAPHVDDCDCLFGMDMYGRPVDSEGEPLAGSFVTSEVIF